MESSDETNPADSPFERFRQFAKKIVSVPKKEIDRRNREYKKERAELRKQKKKK